MHESLIGRSTGNEEGKRSHAKIKKMQSTTDEVLRSEPIHQERIEWE